MKRRRGCAGLILVLLVVVSTTGADPAVTEVTHTATTQPARTTKNIGEECEAPEDCGFEGSVCDPGKKTCQCVPDLPITNGVDKCGKKVGLGENCTFGEQCRASHQNWDCRELRCACRQNMTFKDGTTECIERGDFKFGDRCEKTHECGYDGSVCDKTKKGGTCDCIPELPITNHLDKCGKEAGVNESCTFNGQCEARSLQTECRDNRCACRYERTPFINKDGTIECIVGKNEKHETPRTVDPAMIGVLVGMALMFIIICVVLRLFSKARWRENRTIFNTPNPRLMNVSLLRDSKLLHGEAQRRGSKASVRGPSRQPSMASLRPTSPSASQEGDASGSRAGSRRGSRASSNASATSTRSPKSPSKMAANNTVVPVLENVTVEHQPKV